MTNYNTPAYDGFQTSPEVLRAIRAVAGEDYAPPSDASPAEIEDYISSSAFYRVWSDPTAAEMEEIEKAAWSYADPGGDVLFWGQTTLHRYKLNG